MEYKMDELLHSYVGGRAMSVTVYVAGKDGIEKIVVPQASTVEITNTSQANIILRHANGSVIGTLTAANIVGAVAEDAGRPR